MSTAYSTEGGNTTAVFNPGGEREQKIATRAFLTENVGASLSLPQRITHSMGCIYLKQFTCGAPSCSEPSTIPRKFCRSEIQKLDDSSPRRYPCSNRATHSQACSLFVLSRSFGAMFARCVAKASCLLAPSVCDGLLPVPIGRWHGQPGLVAARISGAYSCLSVVRGFGTMTAFSTASNTFSHFVDGGAAALSEPKPSCNWTA